MKLIGNDENNIEFVASLVFDVVAELDPDFVDNLTPEEIEFINDGFTGGKL